MKKLFLKSSIALATLTLCSGAFASQYPNLPEAIAGSGTGALVGDTLYVGLGSGSDLFYSLNLKEKDAKWEAVPAFPGGKRNQAVAAGVDGKLFVFGGFQNTEVADNQTAKDAYSYNPADKKWEKLVTRSPFGPSAGTSVTTHNGKIYFFGGVNQNIWDGLFQDAKAAGKEGKGKVFDKYFDMSAEDFLFNSIVTSYEPKTNHWANQGYFPYGGRAGAAFAVVDGKFVVANGELKAGLRTDTTEVGTLGDKGIEWKAMQKLPAPEGDKYQEGIAAVMSGISHGTYLVTGGANFPGVAENYKKGVNDHRKAKASKTFRSEVYALDMKTGSWKIVGKLPVGTAGAVSATYGDKVIIAGGQATGKKALTDVRTMSYDGKTLTIE